jgi:acylphosphatase
MGLTGYVRNLRGGEAVEVIAEGETGKLNRLLEQLKTGPPAARVDRVDVVWSEFSGIYTGFQIRY